VTVELRMRRREMRKDTANDHEKLRYREFRVWVNLPCPIRQVWVSIRHVITSIWGLSNPIRQVVPLISHICLYPPHCSHLHPPSLSFSSISLPSLQEHKVKSFLSISPCHDHELTPSTVNTKYNIHRLQHTLSTAYTAYSIHRVQHTTSTAYTKYRIHQVQHTPSIAYTKYSIHQVQHTPSTAYTKYSIHQVQHTPSTAYTEYSIYQVKHTPSTA